LGTRSYALGSRRCFKLVQASARVCRDARRQPTSGLFLCGGSRSRRAAVRGAGGGVCCGAVGFSSPAAAAMLGAMSTTEKKQRDSKRRRGRGSHGASPNMIAGAASPTLKIKTISTAFKLRPLPGASWINGPQAKRCIIGRGRLRAFRATPPSVVADD
jgi:hypothetical protein